MSKYVAQQVFNMDDVYRELQRVQTAIDENDIISSRYETHYSEPAKPIVGDVYRADGTTWNPGDGAGLYQYTDDGTWEAFTLAYITDPTTGVQMTVNSEGRGDVVQHAHPDSSYLHFDFDATGGTSYDIILIDISDTTNYPHTGTSFAHIEELYLRVDAETNASYTLNIGFLENVDATNGDFHELLHISGTKTIGQQQEVVRKFYPNGPKGSSTYTTSSDITTNDTAFQTDVNLRSTLDPSTADTPSGNGDLVLRITSASGANTDFSVEVNLTYHGHS